MKTRIAYFLHSLLFLLGIAAISVLALFFSFRTNSLGLHGWLMNLCQNLDVYHALFYAVPFTWLACLATPLLLFPARSGLPYAKPVAYSIAFLAGFIPPFAVSLCRLNVHIHVLSLVPSVIIGMNCVLRIALRIRGKISERWVSWPFRLIGIDIFLPILVQEVYRQRERRFTAVFFPIQIFLLCLTSALPWIAKPSLLQGTHHRHHPSQKLLLDGQSYQVEVDPRDGYPVVIQYPNRLKKVDPISGRVVAEVAIEPHYDDVQGFALSSSRGEIAYVEPCYGETHFIDAKDLVQLKTVKIDNPRRRNCFEKIANTNRTQWSPESGILLAFTFGDFVQLNAEGNKILSENPLLGKIKSVVDIAIDSGHGVFHQISWDGRLMAMDARTQKPKDVYNLASVPERIVLSRKYNTVFVSLPALGAIEAIELDPYRKRVLIPCFPGVRAMALDEDRDLLFISGFAPYLEIRSLKDFSLIDRISTDSWQRWVALDTEGKRIFISSPADTSQVDRPALGKDVEGRKKRISDPFFPLIVNIQMRLHDVLDLSRRIVP